MSESTAPPEKPLTAAAVVSLREITADTLRAILRLKVRPDQERFVADNATSIAEAYFEPKAWFRAIYADETPVGFLMLYDDPEKQFYYLWRFMIDARYQRLGYGRQALRLIIDHVRGRPGATSLGLDYTPGEGNPQPFYARFGFVETGEVVDGEQIMNLEL